MQHIPYFTYLKQFDKGTNVQWVQYFQFLSNSSVSETLLLNLLLFVGYFKGGKGVKGKGGSGGKGGKGEVDLGVKGSLIRITTYALVDTISVVPSS